MLERVVGLVVVLAAGIYLSTAVALPYGTSARPGAGFFPTLVGVFGCVVGLTMSAVAFRRPVRAAVGREATQDSAARNRALSTVAVLIAFCLLIPWIGYPLVAFGFVTVLLERLGSAWRTAAIVGAVTAAVSFYVFGILLDVPLPHGPW
jgi:O-antigen ligase